MPIPPAVTRYRPLRYAIDGDLLVLERGGEVATRPLTDPDELIFLDLPRIDLEDGRPLRRTAFDVWSAGVRDAVARGREFETTYRAPRPIVTALSMAGAVVVVALCALLLWTWAFRPDPPVRIEPGIVQQGLMLVAVAIVVAVIAVSNSAFARAWRCRRGSHVRISSRGVNTSSGSRDEPFGVVVAADYHPFVRCTRVAFADGRADMWIPAERGAMRRADLVLAALDPRIAAVARAGL